MKYAELTLSGTYRETGSLVRGVGAAGQRPIFRFDRFVEQAERVRRRRSVGKVLITRENDFTCPYTAGLEAIRRVLVRLHEEGKELIFHADEYTFGDVFLASACTRRVIHPDGQASFLGLARNYLFFKKLLARHSIGVEVFRREEYKSAMTPFTEDDVDAHEREQSERLIQTALNRITTAVTSDLLLTESEITDLLSGTLLSAESARERGLVNELADSVSLRYELKQQKVKPYVIKKYKSRLRRCGRRRIAVMFLEGAIIDGRKNRRGALLGQSIAGDWFAEKLSAVRTGRSDALVLRINSPGGSALASEVIRTELRRIAEKMPVIVSMGPVAASGGYWVATAANKIFAHKTTVTGSIGVVGAVFYLRDFLKKRGITHSVIKQGDYADFAGSLRKLSTKERLELERRIEETYVRFLSIVAQSRGIDEQYIHEIGRGHVYSGEEALDRGLVDEIGDLQDAIGHAKKCLDVTSARVSFGPVIKRSFVERALASRTEADDAVRAATALDPAQLASIYAESAQLHRRPLAVAPTLLQPFEDLL